MKYFFRIIHSLLVGQGLKVRIIRRFSIILMFTILSIGCFSNIYFSNIIRKEVNSYSEIIVNQVSKNLDVNFSSLESIINSVYYYEILTETISQKSNLSSYEELLKSKKILEVLRNILYLRKDIEKVTLYSINNSYMYTLSKYNAYDFQEDNTFQNKKWFKDILKYDGRMYVAGINSIDDLEKTSSYFSTFKTIKGNDITTPIGVIRVDLNFKEIADICNEVRLVNDGRVIIIDGSGNTVYDTQTKQDLVNRDSFKNLFSHENEQDIQFNGQKYYVKFYALKSVGWNIAYMAPLKTIYKSLFVIRNLTVFIGIILLIITVFITIRFIAKYTAPLEELTCHLKKIENGDLFPFSNKYLKKDEIGNLILGINSMVEKIDHLIKSEYKLQILTKDAQFSALVAQINPHFLYNVMENISGIGYLRGIPELSIITENLVDMLRYSVNNDSSLVPLSLEIEQIRKYIIIQNARFEDKIELIINVPDPILCCPILKFSLQPLVENAVLHGLSAKSYSGAIEISAKISGQFLYIDIDDDGIGMSSDKLNELNSDCGSYKKQPSISKYHVGVHNVHSRLKLYYGEECGLTYQSTKGKGTMVSIKLPIEENMHIVQL